MPPTTKYIAQKRKIGVFNSLCCVIQTFSFLEFASHIFGLSVFKTLIENNNKSEGIKKQA
jgi:hypothetical protein